MVVVHRRIPLVPGDFNGNPVLPLGRNIKILGSYLYGLLCIGRFHCAEMLSALADDVYASAGH